MEKLVKQDLKKLIKEIDIEKERKILNYEPNYDNFDEIEKIIQNKVKTTETNVVIKNHYYNGDFDRRSIFKSNYRFSVKQASDKKGYALAILNIELEYCNDTNLTVQNLLAGFTAKIPFVLYEKQLQKFNKIIEKMESDPVTIMDIQHADYTDVIIADKKYKLFKNNESLKELEEIMNIDKYVFALEKTIDEYLI